MISEAIIQLKLISFFSNKVHMVINSCPCFTPRDRPHWIPPEISCYVVVFMSPELRYGPGSAEHRFGNNPSKKVEVCTNFADPHAYLPS